VIRAMAESVFYLRCSSSFLAAILLIIGISGYQVVRLKDRVISKTKNIDLDLYRAIIFPSRKAFEADITGFASLFFYARFKKAIFSGEYPELEALRLEHKKISVYSIIFLAAVLCFFAWIVKCNGL
jgi:hypothetical protein